MINMKPVKKSVTMTARTFFFAVFCCFSLGNTALSQEFKQLRIGVDGTYPPFSHRNIDGEFSGFDIDIANAICKKMNAKCTLQQFSRDNLVPALRGKKIDLIIAAMQANDASDDLISLSSSYLKIPSMIIVRKDSILSGLEIEDLQGAQIGALKSSSHTEYLRVHFPDTLVKPFENQSDYFLELINRQLDGVAGDPVLLNDWLQSSDGMNCCRILGTLPHDTDINGEGFGIAVRPQQQKLLKAINNTLKSIAGSGEIAKIRQRHLPFMK